MDVAPTFDFEEWEWVEAGDRLGAFDPDHQTLSHILILDLWGVVGSGKTGRSACG